MIDFFSPGCDMKVSDFIIPNHLKQWSWIAFSRQDKPIFFALTLAYAGGCGQPILEDWMEQAREHYYSVVWSGPLWSNVFPSLLQSTSTALHCAQVLFLFFRAPVFCRKCWITFTLDIEENNGISILLLNSKCLNLAGL